MATGDARKTGGFPKPARPLKRAVAASHAEPPRQTNLTGALLDRPAAFGEGAAGGTGLDKPRLTPALVQPFTES